ncbi:hypothetical protein JY651_04575 [Pyxidicoccus parkwayensis]|uniref:Uncharacterized protein n=1 Tax=Pyxidicoccus parkwayensis TaxID=2813578 RepID=A0ABX7NZK5_9BACT|nr:hypothetical protein [Pyxidicoccus parkwaysis]QSQ24245.1 hypothetical protein JY651_04575 [Pyxidicoccus parkwaysis]
MPELSGCPSCQGFNPPTANTCLHCRAPLSAGPTRLALSWVASLWTLAGASAVGLTLMACYGMPPCDDGTFDCLPSGCDETIGGSDAGSTDGGDGVICVPQDAGTLGDAGIVGDAGSGG